MQEGDAKRVKTECMGVEALRDRIAATKKMAEDGVAINNAKQDAEIAQLKAEFDERVAGIEKERERINGLTKDAARTLERALSEAEGRCEHARCTGFTKKENRLTTLGDVDPRSHRMNNYPKCLICQSDIYSLAQSTMLCDHHPAHAGCATERAKKQSKKE